jgi:hypothetical protein
MLKFGELKLMIKVIKLITIVGVLITSLNVVFANSDNLEDDYEFTNFDIQRNGCYRLKFKKPSFEDDYYNIEGKHSRGKLNMRVNFIDNKPDVTITGPFLGITEFEYELTNNMMFIDVKLNHDSGICKFSYNIISDKFIDNSNKTADNDDLEQPASPEVDSESLLNDPSISITSINVNNAEGIIRGVITSDQAIKQASVDGQPILIDQSGVFEAQTYIPLGGKNIFISALDISGNLISKDVFVNRQKDNDTSTLQFDMLNPLAMKVSKNENGIAIIVGIEDYKNTPTKAIYASSDARIFSDYAMLKLGVPQNRIKTMINDGADETQFLLSIKTWLIRSIKQEQTDVYVFFAGHGLASDDGEQMYLLPYDGSPELLDRTAILRDELFTDIASANPRSVTVFLDTCYSGSTRGSEMLIAARPILLKAKDSAIPEGFTVFTAAAGDETAKPLEEAKHGMFSYFLMKGMEGDADTNGDKQITAGELHAYVKSNVVQQSSGTQTPELQGDADRVLVRFQ